MLLLDHAYFLLAAVAYPLFSFFSYRRLLASIAAGQKVDRKTLYNSTILGLLLLFAGVMVVWGSSSRPWTTLGFNLSFGPMFFVALLLMAGGIVFLFMQLRQVRHMNDAEIAGFRAEFGDVDIVLPRNGNELARFYGVSLTAGIVEEAVWRGFMIWYLSQVMPVWAAAVLSSAGFGVAHAYQGLKNVPKITLVGASFAVLFVLSGSLWLPMIFHTIIDVTQGRLAYEVMNRSDINGSSGNATATASA